MPLVHSCEHEGCGVLTMGRFCVEHERRERRPRTAVPLSRVARASLLVAAGALAATLHAHFGR